MKITHNKVGQNINTSDSKSTKASEASKAGGANKAGSAATAAVESAGASTQATKVELSQRVKDIKKIQEAAKNAPDVDTDKVAKFRQMIADGTYKVDAKAIADKMVDDAMKDIDSE